MFLERISIKGLLSFGPEGIDLPMRPLNVLIGPNGSGKTNFIEALALLKAAPDDFSRPIRDSGGVREWLWKGPDGNSEAEISVKLSSSTLAVPTLDYRIAFRANADRVEVVEEAIREEKTNLPLDELNEYYQMEHGKASLVDVGNHREIGPRELLMDQSILSQIKDASRYKNLTLLQRSYSAMRFYRNWSFGPRTAMRAEQSAQLRHDFLDDGGQNLAVVLGAFPMALKKRVKRELQVVYEGITDVDVANRGGGNLQVMIEEEDGREIPASRLSDGTLRYLCLLTILLDPSPPPLVVIEEPELGLHPDVIPKIAELLIEASERMQLVVTTHSRMLIDALADEPERVVVCSREHGESRLERLNSGDLGEWLKTYSLGDLWSKGKIGGNRW
jgi:predicted ATPase